MLNLDNNKLSLGKCEPCSGNTPKLSFQEISKFLSQLNEWSVNDKQEMIFKTPLDKQPIDGKLRLRSMFCSKFEKMPVDEYTVYSFALDKEQYQYGIWANGALVETTSHKMLNIMCGRNPNIKEVLSEEERV